MKYLISILLLINSIFAVDWNIQCIGEQRSPNIHILDYTFSGEWNDETTVYGELDTCNFGLPFWDSSSPACGGDGVENTLIELWNTSCDDSSFIFTVGDKSGYGIHSFDTETNEYINNTVFVNGYPCMSKSESSMTVAFYDWNDNSNIGLVTAKNLNDIGSVTNYSLSSEEITILKSVCGVAPESSSIDYTPLLNQIITNTSTNIITSDKLTNIDNRQQNIEDTLNDAVSGKTIESILDTTSDIDTFNTTFETTLTDTFDNYSDVFGFGGYGEAPEPISFTMFGNSYTVFDISSIGSTNIELIRNTFLLFAYLWGFIIVFRTT